ncbi:MAG: hypothetical protein JWN43_1195 [Gammaproteobacteria bacterium]|nr:hypothetical protein [Gammaproteobacteria bacterium]
MLFKYVVFWLGCAAAWLIVLPVLVVSGGITLLAYAVFSEVAALFTGRSSKSLDDTTAREMARRVCLGH